MTAELVPDVSIAWRPPAQRRVSEWADENLRLDPLVNADGGRYRTAQTPYAREWMDSVNDPWVRQVAICAGTQVGKTTTINALIGYAIAQDPGPVMVVVPRTADVPTFYERRLMPLVRQTPALLAELTDRVHDAKRREVLFKRALVYLRTSQVPAELASVPVRYLFADEVDKFPGWTGKEAPPLDLARERQRTFWNAFCVVTSTPTVPDGAVWLEYLDGDRRHYWVPCPHCGRFQVLVWAQVKFDASLSAREMREQRQAHYECEHCHKPIDDQAKRGMLAAGVWCPEGVELDAWRQRRESDRTERRSYHLWAGYSPWLTWWQLVAQFLSCAGNPAKLQNWVNSWLAEPWQERLEVTTSDAVSACVVPGTLRGQVPAGCLVATAGVDVQKDRIYYVVRGWGYDEESWLLDCGSVATFAELEAVLCGRVWSERGGAGVRCGLIDSRYRREEVLEIVRRRPQLRMGAGVDRQGPLDFTAQKLDKHPRTGAALANSTLIWSITVRNFKDQLAARMQRPYSWHLPEDAGEDYHRHVVSEHKVRVRSGSREAERWVPRPGAAANHLWDCEVYAMAAARMIRIEALRRDAEAPKRPPPPQRTRGERPSYPSLGNR